MAFFNSPTAFFIGNTNPKEKRFEKNLLKAAKKNGYEKGRNYVSVSKILGGATCSKEAGETIKEAVTRMVKNKEANSRWEAMELLARRYLDGEK